MSNETFAELKGVDIFASGRWNGFTFTDDDLDGMVAAFDALQMSGQVPLKLGHDGPDARNDPATQFAMGWVTRLWRDGRKLMADFDVPDPVKTIIDHKFLKNVSVELAKNVRASTREIPWVLDAVALLGTDRPAVGVLKNLQAFDATRSAASLPNGGCVAFTRADYQPINIGDKTKMSDDNKSGPTAQELLDKIMQLTNRVTEAEGENSRLKSQISSFSSVKQKAADLEAAVAKRDRDERRTALAAVFTAAIDNEEIVPAARERFSRVYKLDDDEAVMAVTVDDAKQFVRENPSPLPRRKAKVTKFSLDRADGEVPPGTSPDVEALMRAQALLKSRNIHAPTWEQLAGAAKEVFAANTELGTRYKFHPDQVARAALN